MRSLRVLACAAILAATAVPAAEAVAQSTPSYNCKRARTFVEKAICQNPSLARKDRRMSAKYFERLNWLKREGDFERADELKNQQRWWLSRRDRCQTLGCLQQAYDQRIEELDYAWD